MSGLHEIDYRQWALSGGIRRASFQAGELHGWCDYLRALKQHSEGEVEAELRASQCGGGAVCVEGSIRTKIGGVCQRCLDELLIDFDISVRWMIGTAPVMPDPERLPEDDWITPPDDGRLDLRALVRDELIMELPAILTHNAPCLEQPIPAEDTATYRAFADLKGLIERG
ncbi:MAG: DUF177 domain-containing protein [Gammaproteobacteria bacterium AqS3]|nr:DUF177 domain-containing protein [Gammaproteobacteria bacterium AqS3]